MAANTTINRISSSFPKSLANQDLVARVSSRLEKFGFTKSNTLLTTSFCCDEISRPLELDFAKLYGKNYFKMGGLAGFPFGGLASFAEMAAHIPDGGNCLMVYGPHVGISSNGEVGTVEREGRLNGGACCLSAIASVDYVLQVHRGTTKPHPGIQLSSNPQDVSDAQQILVGSLLLPHAQRLEDAGTDIMVELPMALYDSSNKMVMEIIQKGCSQVAYPGVIAVVGGIQINTPPEMSDYFMPLQFDLHDNRGQHVEDLLWNE